MHRAVILATLLVITRSLSAEQLKPETVAAFDHYVRLTEQRMAGEQNSNGFLWIDAAGPEKRNDYLARLRKGEVIVQRMETLDHGRAIDVPNGLVHHWTGVVFIPAVSLPQTLALLQDYNNQYKFYSPDVERSRLLSRKDDDFRVYLRLRRKKVVTVVLNTEYDVHYINHGGDRAGANSYSTRIAEVERAGQTGETEKPPGNDNGFLWRLNSYWRFWQRDGGTYVQLEAISLTRDIPVGLGWLVRPFVTSVPQESLQFTLTRTRASLCRCK